MKVDFIEFEQAHLEALGEDSRQLFVEANSDFDTFSGITFTIDGVPALCMGVAPVHQGVWDVVLFPGVLFYLHLKTCYKQVCLWFQGIQSNFSWRRIQATARADAVHHRRFLYHLGFKEEGRLRRYSPEGYDMYMYSIIREEE